LSTWSVGTVPGSDVVVKHIWPPFVFVQVHPGHDRHGGKQTTPLLQLTANGSPQAVPPSWQQAFEVLVASTVRQTTAAKRNRPTVELTLAHSRES
jgi:hypothetical protein